MSSEITLRLSAAQARRLRAIASRLNVTPEKFATVELFAAIDSHGDDATGFLECWPHALAAYGRGVARRKSYGPGLESGFTKLATAPAKTKAVRQQEASPGLHRVNAVTAGPIPSASSLVRAEPANAAIVFRPHFSVPGIPLEESAPAVQVERPHNLASVLNFSAGWLRDARRAGRTGPRSVIVTSMQVGVDARWEALKVYHDRFASFDEAVSCFRAVQSRWVKRWDRESVLAAVRAEAQSLVAGDRLVVFSPLEDAGQLLGAVTVELEQTIGSPVATIADRELRWF